MSRRREQGFSAVELLITLFVAAAFVIAGFQLYDVVLRDGGQARANARATNIAYDYLRRYEPTVPSTCAVSTPLDNSPITVSGLTSVTITVAITCPYASTSGNNNTRSISKITATLRYNVDKVQTYSTYVNYTPTGPPPATPVVTGNLTAPSTPVYTWPAVADATGYTVEYKIGNGSWKVYQANSTNRTATINDPEMYHNVTVSARVTAINENGNSIYGTSDVAIPLWATATLQNSWGNYGSGYTTAAYTKTSDGLVIIKGMVARASAPTAYTPILSLPAGYRPEGRLIFSNTSNSNVASRVDVLANGDIVYGNGGPAWYTLDTIRFNTRTDVTRAALPFVNSWSNYSLVSPDYASSKIFTSPDTGRVYSQGLIQPGTTTEYAAFHTLTAAQSPSKWLLLNTFACTGNWSWIDIVSSPATSSYPSYNPSMVIRNVNPGGCMSTNFMWYPSTYTGWTSLTLASGWIPYGASADFMPPRVTKGSDNVVVVNGMIGSGSTTYDQAVTTLPVNCRPTERMLMTTASASAHARVDILPSGAINFMGTSNAWYSLDSISFMSDNSNPC